MSALQSAVLGRRSATVGAAIPSPVHGSEVLAVEQLTVGFNRRGGTAAIVHGVDLNLAAGRTLVLLGESGSGKSVTARGILRLLPSGAQVGGSVRLEGAELTEMTEAQMREVRGGAIGLVSQDPSGSLDPLRRVGDQLVETLLRHRVVAERRSARAHGSELLERVGLSDPARVMRALPFELSGGMRQRVAIALAVGCRPRVLIADEPTTALDVTIQAQVLELFAQLKSELGIAILLVTHDVGVARVIGDDVAVMYAGRLVETGSVAQVLDDPRHPYTQALLQALPVPGIARGSLRAIPGQPPAPSELPWNSACAFAPRCRHAVDACSNHQPPLARLAGERASACDRFEAISAVPPPPVRPADSSVDEVSE